MTRLATKKKIVDPSKPLRAAIYCRISRDQTGEGLGVERQREACLALAQARGWNVNGNRIFIENDTSATRGKRKLYGEMIGRAEAGEFDVIICWALDRLTRSLAELEALIVLSEDSGLLIATATGDYDLTTDTGRLIGRILASVARGEIERKHARTVAANLQRANSGRPPTVRCFGYNNDGSIRPEEAPLVAEVYQRFLSGAPITKLTDYMNETGLLSGGQRKGPGAKWSRTGVRGMLSNPRYIGERWYRGERLDVRGDWTPIIDEATYAAVQAKLSDPKRSTTTSPARKWLGAGVFLCGECWKDGVRTPVATMQSRGRSRVRKDGSGGIPIPNRCYKCPLGTHPMARLAEPIDNEITKLFVAAFSRPDFASRWHADEMNVDEIRSLRDRSRALDGQEESLARRNFAGDLTDKQLRVQTAMVLEQRQQIETRIAELGQQDVMTELATANDPAAKWASFDIWRQAEVVSRMTDHIVLLRQKGGTRFNPASIVLKWSESDLVAA